jgi:plasmid stability protein
MSNITIDQLEPDLSHRLEQRAAQHGRTIEAEIKSILSSVLIPEASPQLDLATAIDRRFADLGEFELPETPRDAMRAAPDFAAE